MDKENIIFDTHTHYLDNRFNDDRTKVLNNLQKFGVCNVIECSTSLKNIEGVINLIKKYSFIYGALGIHPSYVNEIETNWYSCLNNILQNLDNIKKIVAIGEIGLDYYWKDNAPKQIQIDVFEKQVLLANKLNLPVIVHDRNAHKDTLDILKKHKPKGVLHCYSGSTEMANEVIKLGMSLGFGGSLTFKNSLNLQIVATKIPLDNIVLETDCPYLSPEPNRGKRNDSRNIYYVAQKLASLKNITVDEVLKITCANANKLFLNS